MKFIMPLLLLCSAVLALAYASATPVGAAPDEGAHLRYVTYLVENRSLPSLNITERRASHNDPNYEFHQSPLYYVISVPFHQLFQAVGGGGRDAGAAGCRFVSLLAGLCGTWLIWKIGLELYPGRPWLAATAAAISALLPMRLSLMASVGNDTLAEAVGSLALLLMVRAMSGGWSLQRAALLGGVLGLAVLVKQNHILLLPPAMIAVYLACCPSGGSESSPATVRTFFATGFVTVGVFVAVSGWWFARNHLLYGDPLGMRVFNWYFADTPLWQYFRDMGYTFPAYLGRKVFPTTFASFWGAFGHLSPEHPEWFMGFYRRGEIGEPVESVLGLFWPFHDYPPRSWIYALLVFACWIAVAGWVKAYVAWKGASDPAVPVAPEPKGGRIDRRKATRKPAAAPEPHAEEPRPSMLGSARSRAITVLSVHAVFVLAGFLNFNSTYFQAQGRYLFPALAALSLALAGGWLQFARRREAAAGCGIAAAVLSLATYALVAVIQPGF